MATELMNGQPVREMNVMAVFQDAAGQEHLGELFHLSFSERDESLYVRPVAPTGNYSCGTDVVPPHTTSHTINFREGRFLTTTPAKLSIHASGQAHIKLDEPRSTIVAGPLQMPPLLSMQDRHVATVQVDHFSRLMPVTRPLTTEGTRVDVGFPFLDAPTGRIVLYVNGVEPHFRDTTFHITLDRGQGRVLYVGMGGGRNEILAADPRGLTVLTGWNPITANDPHSEMGVLFVRCE